LNEIYVVCFEDDVEVAFKERADAEEYILTVAEQDIYEDYLLGYTPTYNSYAWELRISASGYRIEKIFMFN
jgi:hypothetical protein